MRNLAETLTLGVIALAAVISGAVITTTGADAAPLWAIAGTAAGALGGAMLPRSAASS